jgi:lipopolysaccharide heptosyltransferase I
MPDHDRILLIRLSAIGDVIHALHGLAALRAARPDAEIGFLVEDRAAALIDGHPDLDHIHIYERRHWQDGLLKKPTEVVGEAAAFLSELRGTRYDVAVDLQGNLKGGILSRLSGAPRRIGLAAGFGKEGNHRFQTEHVELPEGPFHRVDRVLRLLQPLGVTGPAGTPRVAVSAEDREDMDRFLLETGLEPDRFAVLHPGTSAFGQHKRWAAARYGVLAKLLLDRHGLRSVVTWGPGEEELAEEVVAASTGAAVKGPRTRRLTALARLAESAALFVGADTGATHLSALLGTRTVGLFGPKDPRIYGPRGARATVVFKGLDCSPCPERSCPDPVCMQSITTDDVLAAVAEILPREADAMRGA